MKRPHGDAVFHRVSSRIIIIIAVLLTNVAVAVDCSAEWDRTHVEVNQGDSLTLTCTVTRLVSSLDVVRIVHTTNKHSQTMADGYNVKPLFAKMERYRIHYSFSAGNGTMSVTYRGVRGEDSGNISCFKLSSDRPPSVATVHLNVLVLIKEIYLVLISPSDNETRVENGTEVKLRGGHQGVGCVAVADSTLHPPEVVVTLDGVDRTEVFRATKEVAITPDTYEWDSVNELSSYRSRTKLSLFMTSPNPDHDGQTLVCTASAKGFPPSSVSATLSVKYGPLVDCPNPLYSARSGGNVTFMCIVRGNPKVTATWQNDYNTSSDINSSPNWIVREKVIGRDFIQTNLTVTNLTDSAFTSYRLVVSNAEGQTTISHVTLEAVNYEDSGVEEVTEMVDLGGSLASRDTLYREDDWRNGRRESEFEEKVGANSMHSTSSVTSVHVVIPLRFYFSALSFARWLMVVLSAMVWLRLVL